MRARRQVEGASEVQRGQPGQGAGTAAFSWSPRSCPQASAAPCAFWFVLFCFFLSEAKEACAAISREGQWIFFVFWVTAVWAFLQSRSFSSCCVRASRCGGSSCGARALGCVGLGSR